MKGRNTLYEVVLDTEPGAEGCRTTVAGFQVTLRECGSFDSLREQYKKSVTSKMEELARKYSGNFEIIRITLYRDGRLEHSIE